MNQIRIVLLLLCMSGSTLAQDYAMYWNSMQSFNPAGAGMFHKFHGSLMGKAQFIGYRFPWYVSGNFDMKIDALHGGAGFNAGYDEIGFLKKYHFNVNYSYHINLSNERFLSIGASGGMTVASIDAVLDLVENFDTYYSYEFENSFKYKNRSFISNFGLIYKGRKLEFAMSATNINRILSNDQLADALLPKYWVHCAYKFTVADVIGIKPMFLFVGDSRNSLMLPGCLFSYNDMVWAGFSKPIDGYHTNFMAGVDLFKKVRIGYNFGLFNANARKYVKGSHEVVLGFMLD